MTFDTHAFVKELTAAGFSEPQAEAMTTMLRKSRDIDVAELATKADIANIRTDMAHLASKADLAQSQADTLKWVIGTIGFQTAVMIGAVAGLIKLLH